MSVANPTVEYVAELLRLRETYATVPPQSRYNVILKRLEAEEIGPTRLITVVSAVEALARSIVVHRHRPNYTEALRVYMTQKDKAATTLVEEVLKSYGIGPASTHFSEDTWPLFRHAVNYRNLVVHECTYLGQDKYPSLVSASFEVLDELASISGLTRRQA